MITEEDITQEQEEHNIEDINLRTLGSLQEEAFNMSSKHSPPISNPINPSNIYSNEMYTNGQQYLSPGRSDSHSPCLGLSPEHRHSDSHPPHLPDYSNSHDTYLGLLPEHRDSRAPCLDLSPEHAHSDSHPAHLGISPEHGDSRDPYLGLLPEHSDSRALGLDLSPEHSDSHAPSLGLSPEHAHSDSRAPGLGILPEHGDSCAPYLDLLPEHGDSHPPYHSIFQPIVEDLDEGLKDSEDSESNPEITSGVVIFEPDAEPGTTNESEYHFKNLPLHTVEDARRLDYARRIDDLGNYILY